MTGDHIDPISDKEIEDVCEGLHSDAMNCRHCQLVLKMIARMRAAEAKVARARALVPEVQYASWDDKREYPIHGSVPGEALAAALADEESSSYSG